MSEWRTVDEIPVGVLLCDGDGDGCVKLADGTFLSVVSPPLFLQAPEGETPFDPLPIQSCECLFCENEHRRTLYRLRPHAEPRASLMVLCPTCGNKRCPRATHHDHACTASNDPGQPGSVDGGYRLDTAWMQAWLDDDEPPITGRRPKCVRRRQRPAASGTEPA